MPNKTQPSQFDQACKSSPARVVFLDRDGTINVDYGYVHRIEAWHFTPGAEEGLRALQNAGFLLAIVSNQSGIASGKYVLDDVIALHSHVRTLLKCLNVDIASIVVCPHGPMEDCGCRKPKTGMAKMIEGQIGAIDYARSWTIGDKISDEEFGRNLGTRTAILRSRYWTDSDLVFQPDIVAAGLADAVALLLDIHHREQP